MQFLVVTKRNLERFPPDAWTPELLESEAQRVRSLYTEGSIRSIWRRNDEPGAVCIFEAVSREEAEENIASLPLAKLGMLEVAILTRLIPYSGFGPR